MAAPRVGVEAPIDPLPFGKYVLLDRVAQGRLASVHRALWTRPGEPDALIAIKRFDPELSRDPRFAARAERVLARAARLQHPGQGAIVEIDRTTDGSLYAALEWVAGKDLRRVAMALRERHETLPAALVAFIGAQIAEVLAAAHALSRAGKPTPLLHGELSSSDILIGYDGRVRLIGLGSAELAVAAQIPAARLAYQAPEIGTGAACSVQSDVFSLGACLYQVLSLESAGDSRAGRRSDSHITQIIPRVLKQILDRSLSQQPEARWPSAAELAHRLQSWSSSQSQPGDEAALGAFMRRLFEGAREEDEQRVQAWLAAAHDAQSAVGQKQPVRASQLRARLQSSAKLQAAAEPAIESPAPTPQPAPELAQEDPWNDAAERTPAQGVLMEQLAAGMVDPNAKPAVPQLTLEGWDDDPWDEATPANPWISGAEERASAAKPRAPAPAPAPAPKSALPAAPLAVAPVRPPAPLPAANAVVPPSLVSVAPRPSIEPPRAWLRPALIAAAALLVLVVGLLLFRGPSSHEVRTSSLPSPPGAARAPAPVQQAPVTDSAGAPAAPAATTPDDTANAEPMRTRAAEPSRWREPSRARRQERPEPEPAADDLEQEQSADEAAVQPAVPEPPATEREPILQASSAPVPPPAAAMPTKLPLQPVAKPPVASRGPTREAILVSQVAPRFPSRAKRLAINAGTVSILFTIDKTGAVKDASVISAEPAKIFDEAALRAIREWKYQPKLVNGAAAESRQRFTFRFQ